MSFAGKTAIVTGGNSGIGLETSRNLLRNGVTKLAIFDIIEAPEVAQKLKNDFPESTIVFRRTDVSIRLEVDRSFKEIHKQFAQIDIVVNSAGFFDERNVEKVLSINLLGTIYCTQAAVEVMSIEKGGKGGIIANVASVVGLDIAPGHPIYNTSKHGVIGFTRSLGNEFYYNIYGIKFVIICPGITTSPFLSRIPDNLYRDDARLANYKLGENLPRQTPAVCGELLVERLASASNGSIWILDDGQAREVVLKNHWLPN